MEARPLPVIVNRSGGAAAKMGERLLPEIEAAFAKAGCAVEVTAVEGHALPDRIGTIAGRTARIVVAGGDGSLGGAAAVLAGTDTELAILPLGTLNHLARDLGIPPDLEAAAALAAGGTARAIDLGFVNDRPFVNNASVGLYSLMVRQRTAEQKRRHIPKWLATVPAAWAALGRLPHHKLHVRFAGRDRRITTPLLFVGNNDYSLDRGSVGQRDRLDDGELSVFAVSRRSRAGLIWFAARTLVGHSRPAEDFAALGTAPDLIVEAHADRLEIAIDGEVTALSTPLRFRVEPAALRVVAPSAEPAAA
jgi:diacylglycerol kinase family enzyme